MWQINFFLKITPAHFNLFPRFHDQKSVRAKGSHPLPVYLDDETICDSQRNSSEILFILHFLLHKKHKFF